MCPLLQDTKDNFSNELTNVMEQVNVVGVGKSMTSLLSSYIQHDESNIS